MQNSEHSPEPCLFTSRHHTILVLDIPTSISAAQEASSRLLSSKPQEVPHQSLEPVSEKGRARLQQNIGQIDKARDAEYTALVQTALVTARSVDLGRYCYERLVYGALCGDTATTEKVSEQGQKRQGDNIEHSRLQTRNLQLSNPVVTEDDLKSLLTRIGSAVNQPNVSLARFEIGCYHDDLPLGLSPPDLPFIHHSKGSLSTLSIYQPHNINFYIPPHSGILNAPLASSITALTALSTFLANTRHQKFPLLLLDPPWPNRSARRSSTYSSYDFDSSTSSLEDLQDLLLSIGLTEFLADDAYIAIWITNRPAVRQAAMELIESWDAALVEEWIWTKITTNGEPLSELDGLWRKPWEVCLIARRQERSNDELDASEASQPIRRVILAVPDLHSRKPCLKDLFKTLLFGNEERTSKNNATPVLELFARYAVAGWFSWGDEALKYQWTGCWRDDLPDRDT